jgi:hypothetical protein
MNRRLTTMLAILAVLAICAGAPGATAPAHAAKGMEIALQDDAVFLYGLRNPFKGLNKARALHTTYIRANVTWNTAVHGSKKKKKPKRVRYRWDRWDDLIQRAGDRGMAVELTLTLPAPRWAAKKRFDAYVHRPNTRLFGQFAEAAARHFIPLGVDRFTIANEPNLKLWLSPMRRAPQIYREMYVRSYNAIKAVDSNAKVFIGETAPYGTPRRTIAPLEFIRRVTCVNDRYRSRHCPGLKTDGYAHHPYDFRHKPTYRYPGKDNVTIATIGRLAKGLARLRNAGALTTPEGGTPYIYLTEYGYFAGANYKLPQAKQAKYLVKGFKIARNHPRVKQMLQFVLAPATKGQPDFFATQIMTGRFKPLKAYTALKKWADRQARSGGIKTSP